MMMRSKVLTIIAATVAVIGAGLASTKPAEAYCGYYGCGYGYSDGAIAAGIAGGIVAGAIAASATQQAVKQRRAARRGSVGRSRVAAR